ncbi:HEAT repeat domain-containing protein [Synechococcus sp. HK05]|uniref:HEAT repeat domain-containing protein n=1 Tax=Synechococcus sp. HK05 TaxID=2725975 RepID=UPI001C38DF3D|nr:HEAT repeat domain-containing protein [Synechococcus sp. HK05]MBV2352311.1 HEAT repeat domain-containing protein [Synechococcus sp. HK05]
MPSTAAAQGVLSAEQHTELATRLGRWRRQPLSPEELAELLPRIADPDLALAVGERLGMAGPGAIALILELCSDGGCSLPLIRALGICHHPQARDQLLQWLHQAGELRPAVLEALACWGQEIDLSIIESALAAPAQAERLAGLALLTFRSRSLSTEALLTLTQPLLNDLRAEVVIATLRLLQRRQEPEILAVLDSCIDADQLPGVAETAIQALGCIGSQDSCRLLLARMRQQQPSRLDTCIRRQLQAQVRHRAWLEQQLRAQNLTL